MTAMTITQAQDKGLRHHFAGLREFAAGLFAAHGGWMQPQTRSLLDVMAERYRQHSRRKVIALADHCEAYSPSLSAELRIIAMKG